MLVLELLGIMRAMQYLPQVSDTVGETSNQEENIEEISDPGAEAGMLVLQELLGEKLFWVGWRSWSCWWGDCISSLYEGCPDLLLRQTFLVEKVSLDLLRAPSNFLILQEPHRSGYLGAELRVSVSEDIEPWLPCPLGQPRPPCLVIVTDSLGIYFSRLSPSLSVLK